jgi:agmatinase
LLAHFANIGLRDGQLWIRRNAVPHYQPANSLHSPRFTGVRTFARLPHVQTTEDVDLAVVGLPFDTGATFKVGARFGPESVRSASHMLRDYNPELDVKPFQVLSCIDYGDAPVVPGYIHDSYDAIANTLRPLAESGIVTLGLGGDHSIALAELRALAAVHGPLALVQFDSHGDLWDAYYGDHKYTHGTPFRRAIEEGLLRPERSLQLGMRGPLYGPEDLQMARDFGFTVLTTTQLLARTPAEIGELVRATVGDATAFLSFDVDFFDPAFAPGTGTPEVGGPTSFQGLQYLRACTGVRWAGGDVVEVLPALDHAQITAHLAAQVGYEFLSLVALARV